MSGIFTDPNRGGVPPSAQTCNTYTPTNGVIGEGPFYVSANCTTYLTDCNFNAIISEIAAAVDLLGFSYNANRIDNLGQALAARFQTTGDGAWVIRTGDTMTGALYLPAPMPIIGTQATHKNYVDMRDALLQDNINAGIETAKNELKALIDQKVDRSGDTMTGSLILWRDPVLSLEAATRQYVDGLFSQAMNTGIRHAPSTNEFYGSYNGKWEPIPIQSDAPRNSQFYGRFNGGWQVISGGPGGAGGLQFVTTDATLTGDGTIDNPLSVVGGGGGADFSDAPSNGITYGRRDGAWSAAVSRSGDDGMNGSYKIIGNDREFRVGGTNPSIWLGEGDDFGLFKTFEGTDNRTSVIRFHPNYAMFFHYGQATFGFQYSPTNNTYLYFTPIGGVVATNAACYKPGGGPWLDSSDARIKEVKRDFTRGLAAVEAVMPVVYKYLGNDSNEHNTSAHRAAAQAGTEFVGVVAQSIEAAFPEMVSKGEGHINGEKVTDMRTVDTGPLIFALVNAVKELSARVAALEAK